MHVKNFLLTFTNRSPVLVTILYQEPCSTCDVYTSTDRASADTLSPMLTSNREMPAETTASMTDTTITSDSENGANHATMTTVCVYTL